MRMDVGGEDNSSGSPLHETTLNGDSAGIPVGKLEEKVERYLAIELIKDSGRLTFITVEPDLV